MSSVSLDYENHEALARRPVALYFGGASSEEFQELLNKRAIHFGCTMTHALHVEFRIRVKILSTPNRFGKTYFDLLLGVFSEADDVLSPKATISSYMHNGSKYPLLIFENSLLCSPDGTKSFLIRDNAIDWLGKEFEADFQFEYVGFKRLPIKKSSRVRKLNSR